MKKIAQDVEGIVKTVFDEIYDPENKIASLSKFIGPAVITKMMHGLGFGFYGTLVGILMSVFNVDVYQILKTILSSLAPKIQSGGEFTIDEVSSKVKSSFESGFAQSKASSMTIQEILMVKNAKRYSHDEDVFDKLTKLKDLILGNDKYRSGLGDGSQHVLVKVFTKIFSILLMSMGLMAAGQAGKALLGKPNLIDKNSPKHTQPQQVLKQLKYEIKPSIDKSEKVPWTVSIKNTPEEISKFILKCVRNCFEVSNISDSEISRSNVFQDLVDDINIFNSRMKSDKVILLPPEYKNELSIAYPIIKDLS